MATRPVRSPEDLKPIYAMISGTYARLSGKRRKQVAASPAPAKSDAITRIRNWQERVGPEAAHAATLKGGRPRRTPQEIRANRADIMRKTARRSALIEKGKRLEAEDVAKD